MARPIVARALVPAPRDVVFEFLSDLDNHWELTGDAVERLESDRDGALVRMRGPLGIERKARTRVLSVEPPARMSGEARVESGAVGAVRWSLEPADGGTSVELAASLVSGRRIDRLVMALGGRAWFRHCFDHALAALAARYRDERLPREVRQRGER